MRLLTVLFAKFYLNKFVIVNSLFKYVEYTIYVGELNLFLKQFALFLILYIQGLKDFDMYTYVLHVALKSETD